MAEFTNDIRHIKGSENITADTLSRILSLAVPPPVDYTTLASEQRSCEEIRRLRQEPSSLRLHVFPHDGHDILCDVSLGFPRPLVPVSLQFSVFAALHGLAHQGPVPTTKTITACFVWRGMKRQI